MEVSVEEEQPDVIPGYKSISDFTQDGFKVLVEATKNANALPQDRNFDYYKTHESFRNLMNQEGSTILQLINGIVKEQGVTGNFMNRDLEEKIEVIIDANDSIFERVAINLDEVNGIRKNPLPVKVVTVSATLPVSGSWNKIENVKVNTVTSEAQETSTAINSVRLITGHNIQRPQKFFKDRIDNGSKFPWEPRIKDKPNSLKPLAIFLEEDENGDQCYSHPYEFELERFNPTPDLLETIDPLTPKDLSETPLKMVETEEDLNLMLEDLRKYKELAVDLEHHSYRTYLGITCLMQISTIDTDYLIDTLSLRDKLWVLNEVFTKPTIVKIFHGAESDIQWLQRDLCLYVVNMFDTFQAIKQLGYEQRSLKYLLIKFCNVYANKHFQLADWRIRPLPDELKKYAREDTHYLIYIYHKLRNELLEMGNNNSHILKSVIQKSTDVCKIRYKKPILKDDSHLDIYRKFRKLFDNRQMYALKELYKWRDTISREEDESIGYVLPNHMLLQIAEILPREMQGVLACCNPIPPLVRANLLEIHKIILKAREQSLVKPILSESSRSFGTSKTSIGFNIDNPLNCPHDMSYSKEIIDDLPTLLGEKLKKMKADKSETGGEIKTPILIEEPVEVEKRQPVFDVFEKIEESLKLLKKEANKKVGKFKFLGPYERYKLVKPYIQAEEDKKLLLEKEKVLEKKITEDANGIINIELPNNEMERKVSSEANGMIKVQVLNKVDAQTDEERIARIHEHFKEVASESPQILPSSSKTKSIPDIIPLRQMHGVKRKRSPSRSPDEEQPEEEVPTIEQIAGPLIDVRPNPQHSNRSNNKRKCDFDNNESKRLKTEGINIPRNKKNKKLKQKQLMKVQNYHEKQQQTQEGDSNNGLTHLQQRALKNKNKKRYRQQNLPQKSQQYARINQQDNQSNQQQNQRNQNYQQQSQNNQHQFYNDPNQQQNRLNRQQNRTNWQQNRGGHQQNRAMQQQNRPNQQQDRISQHQNGPNNEQNYNRNSNRQQRRNNEGNNFKAFDYGSVDFQQRFQGGAGSVNNATRMKPNFKAKNKSKIHGRGIGKGNNKSQFFGPNSNTGRGKNR